MVVLLWLEIFRYAVTHSDNVNHITQPDIAIYIQLTAGPLLLLPNSLVCDSVRVRAKRIRTRSSDGHLNC